MAKKPLFKKADKKPSYAVSKKSGGGAGRTLALSGAFAAAVAGGGGYYYAYHTNSTVEGKVQSIERVYDLDCHTRQTVLRQEFTTPATPQAAEKKEIKDVTTNADTKACHRTPMATIIHTDNGAFYNVPSLLHAKTQDTADGITVKFNVGSTYIFKLYGAEATIPGTGISFHKNIVSAEPKPEYVAPVSIPDFQLTTPDIPEFQPYDASGVSDATSYSNRFTTRYNVGPFDSGP